MKTAKGILDQLVKDIAGLVSGETVAEVVKTPDYGKLWWRAIANVPEPRRSKFMSVLMRLRRNGMPLETLTEVANDYSRRWATIKQPFAYYSQSGEALMAANVRANERAHEALKRKGYA